MENVENIIRNRFEELSAEFPETIQKNSAQVMEVLSVLKEHRGKLVLDAGCGKGRVSMHLKGARVFSLDFSFNLVKKVKDKKKLLGSVAYLPFQSNTFDYVICVEVIEHLPNIELGITEMVRVLKKNGKLLIIDKNKFSLHPKIMLPTSLWKKYLEFRDNWMYKRNFKFREKNFTAREILRILNRHCTRSEYNYLTQGNGKAADFIYRLIPYASYFISWVGVK